MPMRSMIEAAVAGAVLLMGVVAPLAAAPVYKWVDAQGQVHYGDTPKPGWTRVDRAAPAPGAAARTPAPAVDEVQAQLRIEQCARRREQLETYQNASQVVTRDVLGSERVLSETERLKLIEQTQRQVAELCGAES